MLLHYAKLLQQPTRLLPRLNNAFRLWSSNAKAVSLDDNKRFLTVHFENSQQDPPDSFPYTWLRENCRCPDCFEPSSLSRVVGLTEFPANIKPTSSKVTPSGDFEINWSDGHSSSFPRDFLEEHSFTPASRQRQFKRDTFEEELWSADTFQDLSDVPSGDYKSVMENDEALLDYLLLYARYGFAVLKGVPLERGHIKAMQNRVAFERLTHYGSGYTVEVKEQPSNIAYTSHRLGFHTDLTHYDYMPSSIFLHCLVQHTGEGGETVLVDGFKVASILRDKYPDAFKLLTETVFQFRDIGTDMIKFYTLNRAPIITFDYFGKFKRINWAQLARDPRMNLPLEQVEPMYEAMRIFEQLLNDPNLHIQYKMQPGEMLTFSNTRLLHGRTELKGTGGISERLLQGGYMDWDEIASRIRVLQRELGRVKKESIVRDR